MEEWNQWRLFLNSGSVLDYLAYKRAKEMEDTGAGACRASRRGFGEIGLTKKSDESRVTKKSDESRVKTRD